MNTMSRFVSAVARWMCTNGVQLYRHHREACVANLERGGRLKLRVYYFGFGFFTTLVFVVTNSVNLACLAKKCAWLDDPWWSTVMFANFFTTAHSFSDRITRLYLSIPLFLGFAFELFSREQVPAYIKIFSTENYRKEEGAESVRQFRQRQQWLEKISHVVSYLLVVTVIISTMLVGYLNNLYHINAPFYLLWSILAFLVSISSTYILIGMPCNLVLAVYYLNLRQKCLQVKIKKTLPIQKVWRLLGRYHQCLMDYEDINRLLGDYNRYWGFYLWTSITICPAIICQAVYVFLDEDQKNKAFFLMITISFANQLTFTVYHSSKVDKHNRRLTALLVAVYRRKLESNLVGDFRRHLHLAALMEHVRVSKYTMTTVHGHHIGHQTYLVLLFKFVFVFFKLIINRNFYFE